MADRHSTNNTRGLRDYQHAGFAPEDSRVGDKSLTLSKSGSKAVLGLSLLRTGRDHEIMSNILLFTC